jgi:hypothetical protein
MPRETILTPVFALVMLTFVVWTAMYVLRVRFMKQHRIHPQRVKNRAGAVAELQPVAGPADNFQNLMEMPGLFYLLVVFLYVLDRVDAVYLAGAWAFVGLRYLHSFIHVTYNRVMHRFLVYQVGVFLLWFMWARLALQVF